MGRSLHAECAKKVNDVEVWSIESPYSWWYTYKWKDWRRRRKRKEKKKRREVGSYERNPMLYFSLYTDFVFISRAEIKLYYTVLYSVYNLR